MKKETKKIILFMAIALLLPGILYILVWAAVGGYPFGQRSILLWDMNHQYADLFQYYKNILHGEMSIDYSFSKSFGGNNIALFAYYLSSPINILILLFDDIPLFIFVLTACKFSLSGLTSFIYFRKHFDLQQEKYPLLLSQCYALMAYNVLQASNIMWLDGVICLPLLLLSVDYFLKNKRIYMLPVMVAVSILANWYSAYMAILFTCLYFMAQIMGNIQVKGLLYVMKGILRYALSCILGIGLSAILFVPTIASLMQGKGGFNADDFKIAFRESFMQVLQGNVIGTLGNSNQLNLFCGSIILLLVILFLLNREEKIQKRIITLVAIVAMIFSANCIPLENIWNGFRKVASYYCRFSFVIIMLLLLIAGRSIKLKKVSAKSIVLAVAIAGVAIIPSYGEHRIRVTVTIIFLVIEGITYYFSQREGDKNGKTVCGFVLFALVILELTANMYICFGEMYGLKAEEYFAASEEIEEKVEEIKELETSDFYRMENTVRRTENSFCESQVYNYLGIAHYTSGLDQSSADIMYRLGYVNSSRMPLYRESILTSDSLFGIRYLISDTAVTGMEEISEKIYYNPYAISLGTFTQSDDVRADFNENSNPFEAQNQLFSAILGEELQLYVPVEAEKVDDFKWSVKQSEDEIIYGYIKISGIRSNVELYVNGTDEGYYDLWNAKRVFGISGTENNEQSFVELTGTFGKKTSVEAVVYKLDVSVFETVMKKLKEREFEPSSVTDGNVEGTYVAEEDGYLFLSVLYDEGWTLYIDGVKTEISEFAGSFIKIPVHKGTNSIKMVYTAKWIKEGMIISLISLIIFSGFLLVKRRKVGQK